MGRKPKTTVNLDLTRANGHYGDDCTAFGVPVFGLPGSGLCGECCNEVYGTPIAPPPSGDMLDGNLIKALEAALGHRGAGPGRMPPLPDGGKTLAEIMAAKSQVKPPEEWSMKMAESCHRITFSRLRKAARDFRGDVRDERTFAITPHVDIRLYRADAAFHFAIELRIRQVVSGHTEEKVRALDPINSDAHFDTFFPGPKQHVPNPRRVLRVTQRIESAISWIERAQAAYTRHEEHRLQASKAAQLNPKQQAAKTRLDAILVMDALAKDGR